MRVKIHVHRNKKVHTFDAFAQSEIDDLVYRLLEQLSKSKTEDNAEEGHKFYGNQYVTIAGQGEIKQAPVKPTSHNEKGIKHGVAQLLTSGHHFSLTELASITGATEKQVTAALGNLNYETKAGQLHIKKEADGYIIKMKGAPASPVKEPPVAAKVEPVPEKPAESVPKAEPPPLPDLTQPTPPGPAPSAPGAIAQAPASPMSKAEANVAYKHHMDETLAVLKTLAPEHANHLSETLGLHFKNEKAKGMAQWLANTTGKDVKIEPQKLFKADAQIVKDLVTMSPDAALSAWKKNTALEKQGKFGVAPKKVEPVTVPQKPTSTVAHSPAFPQIKDYGGEVAPLKLSDFEGGSSAPFYMQMVALEIDLQKGHTDSIDNKVGVQKSLEEKLKDSPAFQELQKSKVEGNSLVATLISAWAGSSGDTHPISVANQISVREAFGMNTEEISNGNMSGLHGGTEADDEKVFIKAASQLSLKYGTEAEKQTFRAGLRDFALAQYQNTQEHLAAKGIKEVYVARGMKTDTGSTSAEVHLKLQPASSFSAKLSTAYGFSSGDSMFFVKVPASQVLSSYVTGFGCTSEHEVVVLAHPNLRAVQIKAELYHQPAMEKATQAFTKKKEPISGTITAKPKEKAATTATKISAPAPGVSSPHAKKAYQAALKGDWGTVKYEQVQLENQKLFSGKQLPASTKYINGLLSKEPKE